LPPVLRAPLSVEPPSGCSRESLADLLLDAYRGTIDDEGETRVEALQAIDFYFGNLVPEYSVLIADGGLPVAMSLVVVVNGLHYVDPVVTASDRKRQQLGATAVSHCLERLRRDGVAEVGAVITDGNTASERLFTKLGFVRAGDWV